MIKKVICFLLNLVMSVLVLGLISMSLISNTVLNRNYIKKKLEENNFYERTYADIKEDFENYTMQSGLELEILDGLFTKEKVTTDINLKIDSIFEGNDFEVNSDSITNELDARINQALEKNNRVPSEQEKESIKLYENTISDCYQAGILYGKSFSVNPNYFKTPMVICVIGIVMISVILLILNKSVLNYFARVGINLLFSGILFCSIKFLLEKRIRHILILDAKFSNFLVNSLTDIIKKIYELGTIVMIIGCALIVFGSLEKFKKTIENKND